VAAGDDGNSNQHLRCFTAWHSSLASFFPGYFARVMATGIVSLAAHFLGHKFLTQALLWLNVFPYAVLWAITFIRFVCYRAKNRKPRKAVDFPLFTCDKIRTSWGHLPKS
jgi:hypothetical protein